MQLPDFLSRPFIFIDIPGLFLRFCGTDPATGACLHLRLLTVSRAAGRLPFPLACPRRKEGRRNTAEPQNPTFLWRPRPTSQEPSQGVREFERREEPNTLIAYYIGRRFVKHFFVA
jgi:hypothetical protein